jgi:acyl-CoA dehydrogenase
MTRTTPEIIDWLMTDGRDASRPHDLSSAAFMALVDEKTGVFAASIDRAVAGGFLADRVAYAFAAGYEAALRRLVPGLPKGPIVSLCVTESGGGHPRAIQTRLDRRPPAGGFVLTGEKTFITAALEAEILLVAASVGTDPDGKNRIRMVRVDRHAPGVTVAVMPDLPFVPEISHGTVSFDGVAVDEGDVLAGDGYADYIKPFRTIEDLSVLGAVMGYLLGAALSFSWPRESVLKLLALIASAGTIARGDPGSPAVHLALAGLTDLFDRFLAEIEPLWERADAETRARWMRDRGLLAVAEKARRARLAAAWERYNR